jgi:hypothetical protein
VKLFDKNKSPKVVMAENKEGIIPKITSGVSKCVKRVNPFKTKQK